MQGSLPEKLKYIAVTTALLAAISVAAFVFRSYFAESVLPAPPRMQGETTQAWRYARMVFEGEDIPAVDSLVMYPGGFRTSENSIFEEHIAGWAARMLSPGNFDGFIVLFSRLFPVLGCIALFLWMRASGSDFRNALLAALMYGIFLPALLRTRGESLYRETVAVPLILFALAPAEAACRSRMTSRAAVMSLLSGILLFLALACWKVTSFISLLILFYMLCRRSLGSSPAIAGVGPALAQIAGALFLSHMRNDSAISSPATAVAAVLLLSSLTRNRLMPALAIGLSVVSVIFASSPTTAHVTELVAAKARFLLTHPADPLRLSPDARLFWVSGYGTPGIGEIILLFLLPFVAAAFGAGRFWSRGESMLRWALPVSLAAYIFFDRLHVLLAVAIVPVMVEIASRVRWRAVAMTMLLGLQALFLVPVAGVLDSAGLHAGGNASLLSENELAGLLRWLQRSTREDEAVLGYWHLSGMISAYAGRPVVTATFFENLQNRRTIQEFAGCIFEPEDSLARFMESRRCSLVVYQADFTLDRSTGGLLYLSGRTEVPAGCAALSMQYSPDSLRDFGLVYQGPSLRVFRLGAAGIAPVPGVLYDQRFQGLFEDYDAAMQAVTEPFPTAVSLARAGRANGAPDLLSASLVLLCSSSGSIDDATGVLQELTRLHLAGRYPVEQLAGDFEVYLSRFGPDGALRADLGTLFEQSGMPDEARAQYIQALEESPGYAPALEGLGRTGGAEG